jgi:hypothetical protein
LTIQQNSKHTGVSYTLINFITLSLLRDSAPIAE